MYSVHDTGALPPAGFPIRKSPDQSLFSGSPRLIAAYRVLHRLPLPRHPPYALSSLTIKNSKLNQSTRHTCLICLTTNLFYAIVKERYFRHQVPGYRFQETLLPRTPCLLPSFKPNSRQNVSIDLIRLMAETISLLLKEVIQPQVPLRLPCYDFTPVTDHSLGRCLPCGLAHALRDQSTPMV